MPFAIYYLTNNNAYNYMHANAYLFYILAAKLKHFVNTNFL